MRRPSIPEDEMNGSAKLATILMADDDEGDRLLTSDAFADADLVEVVKGLGRYWFEIVDLPPPA